MLGDLSHVEKIYIRCGYTDMRKHPEAFLKECEGYIHTDAYSGYNAISGVKRCLCYTHLRQAFADALPKDIHTPEASKPAEAILRQ